jgi:hypothetical protein
MHVTKALEPEARGARPMDEKPEFSEPVIFHYKTPESLGCILTKHDKCENQRNIG